MQSALSPREIQARIRAGATPSDVAKEAGVTESQIEAFTAPVLAERAHVAGMALQSPVRRSGEPSTHQSLRQIVEPVFAARAIPFDDVTWDAYRGEDKRWIVRATWPDYDAEFLYDLQSRFSVARNDDARSLIGDLPAMVASPLRIDPDTEPTIDLDTGLTSTNGDGLAPGTSSDSPDDDAPARNPLDGWPGLGEDDPFAYDGAALTAVGDRYDIIPAAATQMDVLYDMLSSLGADDDFDADDADSPLPVEPTPSEAPSYADHGGATLADPTAAPADSSIVEAATQETSAAGSSVTQTPAPAAKTDGRAHPEPAPHNEDSDQQPLIEVEVDEEQPKRKKSRRVRIPSWDEILFGPADKK